MTKALLFSLRVLKVLASIMTLPVVISNKLYKLGHRFRYNHCDVEKNDEDTSNPAAKSASGLLIEFRWKIWWAAQMHASCETRNDTFHAGSTKFALLAVYDSCSVFNLTIPYNASLEQANTTHSSLLRKAVKLRAKTRFSNTHGINESLSFMFLLFAWTHCHK